MNHSELLKKLGFYLSITASAFLALLYFMPWAPELPKEDLEHSWQLGMNYATAHGMHLGSDIVFTFGPFSAAHTRNYYPGTFSWALVVTGALGLFLVGCAVRSAQKCAIFILIWGLLISLISSLYLKDALFLTASFFAFLCLKEDIDRGKALGLWALFGVLVLAMVSLVKVSFAIASISALVCAMLLPGPLVHRLLPGFIYMLSVAAFWLMSGQPLFTLWSHIRTSVPIVNGYTDAMALSGAWNPIVLYCTGAGVTLMVALRRYGMLVTTSLMATFFFAFKAAYVRQDIHEVIAAGVLAMMAAWFASPRLDSRGIVMLMAAVSLCSYSLGTQAGMDMPRLIEVWLSQGQRSFIGLRDFARNSKVFDEQFSERLSLLSRQHPLPQIAGTADNYSVRQTTLIANGAKWNPRPILQSYSAYNGELARLNAAHLSGSGRPDTLVFRVEPIDARLPAMEDGLSWPEIWSSYKLQDSTRGDLFFSAQPQGQFTFSHPASVTFTMGEAIVLPYAPDTLVWAQIKVRKTLFGKVASLLFKVPPLRIALEDQQGRWSRFRYLPAVGEAGFLLSPLIRSTADFERLTRQISEGTGITGSIRRFRVEQEDSLIAAYALDMTIETSLLNIQDQAKFQALPLVP